MDIDNCPRCGSDKIQVEGVGYTPFRQVACLACKFAGPTATRDEKAIIMWGELPPEKEQADEATCAQYEAVIRDLVDACDRLMGDSDLPDDNSHEMKAMKRAVAILKTRC